MANKEIKIAVPEGYEIDRENSTFECIKFKKKEKLTYDDVCRALFSGKNTYYIQATGHIGNLTTRREDVYCSSNAPSFYQLERLLALNKLMNVAEYLNEKTLDWNDDYQAKWYIYYDHTGGVWGLSCNSTIQSSYAYFDSEEHAEQAIEILGEDTIKCALGVK